MEPVYRDEFVDRLIVLERDKPAVYAEVARRLGAREFVLYVDLERIPIRCDARRIEVVPELESAVFVKTSRFVMEAIRNGHMTAAEAVERRLGEVHDVDLALAIDGAMRAYTASAPSDTPPTVGPVGGVGGVSYVDLPPLGRSPTAPSALVIGAGVTGLTVAHELAERGFRVQVVERMRHNERGGSVWVGGVAASQFARIPFPGEDPRRGDESEMVRTQAERTLPWAVSFLPDSDEVLPACAQALIDQNEHNVREIAERIESWVLANGPGAPPILVQARAAVRGIPLDPTLAARRARNAHEALSTWLDHLGIANNGHGVAPDKALHRVLIREAIESDTSPSTPEADAIGCYPRDRVVFIHEEGRVPGEHGYRFFPSFYRNLFDTMRRTPLYDEYGDETGRTAFDNLVPTQALNVVIDEDVGYARIPRQKPQSFAELRGILQDFFEKLDFDPKDILLFEARLLRFVTSSRRRLQDEVEKQSWEDYIGVKDFSPKFQDFLRNAPKALVAMTSDEIDARTHGVATVQLLLDQLGTGQYADLTLNGPTTLAWLRPWKDYLRRQGVDFFVGSLKRVEVVADAAGKRRLKPIFDGQGHPFLRDEFKCPAQRPVPEGGDALFEDPDYVVLAVPLETLWKVIEESPGVTPADLTGDLAAVDRWRRVIADEVGKQTGETRPRLWEIDMPRVAGTRRPIGPFRDFAGIQFFFRNGYRVVADGHSYFLNTLWGLSSITQPTYWRVRRVLNHHGYLSALSIDIGDWYTPGQVRKSAIQATPQQIAEETWMQIQQNLPPTLRGKMALPNWYHLDRYLHFDADGNFLHNGAPFLINRPSDNAWRPGVEVPEPLPGVPGSARPDPEPPLDELAKIGGGLRYQMSREGWLVAGPHMRTFTHMTTMEAANESARHAVNALLHAHASRAGGKMLGEFCRVWSPEECGLEDVAPLRELDRQLVARNLPHFVEILGFDRAGMPTSTDAGWPAQLDRLVRLPADLLLAEAKRQKLDGVVTALDWLRKKETKLREDLGVDVWLNLLKR